jgi:hypothetical protein
MSMNIVWRKPALDTLLNNPSGTVGRHLKKKGSRITAAARGQVGVRTGALRNSIHMRHFRDPRGQYIKVGSSLSYARMHHDGTKPHLILPTKGKNLRFFSKGFMVFTQMVRHPGTKPNRYLTDNLKLVK